MTQSIPDMLAELAEIDAYFENLQQWGAATAMYSKDRERLVNRLRAAGVDVEHKWQLTYGSGGQEPAPTIPLTRDT